MSSNLALEPPVEELCGSDSELCLTEAERAMVETVGLFGDEGWEIVAAKFPITWHTFHSVPSARVTFQSLVAKGVAVTNDGRVELTADGRRCARMLG